MRYLSQRVLVKLSPGYPPESRKKHKLHDEAEKDRKRDDGDFRHRRIEEPPLAIHTQLPEDKGKEDGGVPSHGGPSPDSERGGGARDSEDGDGGGGEGDGTITKRFDDNRVDGVDGAWELVAEEVGTTRLIRYVSRQVVPEPS